MASSISVKDRARIAIGLFTLQTKPENVGLETHILELRQRYQRRPLDRSLTVKHSIDTWSQDQAAWTQRCKRLEDEVKSLKRRLVETEMELGKRSAEIKAPPAKKKKAPVTVTLGPAAGPPAPPLPLNLPTTSEVDPTKQAVAPPQAATPTAAPAKKRTVKPKKSIAGASGNVEGTGTFGVKEIESLLVQLNGIHGDQRPLYGPIGLLAPLLLSPTVPDTASDQLRSEIAVDYALAIINGTAKALSMCITQSTALPYQERIRNPHQIIDHIAKLLHVVLPPVHRFLRSTSAAGWAQVVLSTQELIIKPAMHALYRAAARGYASLMPGVAGTGSAPVQQATAATTTNEFASRPSPFGVCESIVGLLSTVSNRRDSKDDNVSSLAEVVATCAMTELERRRADDRRTETQELLRADGDDAPTSSMRILRDLNARLASNDTQHYLITVLQRTVPFLPMGRPDTADRRNGRRLPETLLTTSVRSKLLQMLLCSLTPEPLQPDDKALCGRLVSLAETMMSSEGEEYESIADGVVEHVKSSLRHVADE